MAFTMLQFMVHVTGQDTVRHEFGRFTGSSLDGLIALLSGPGGGPAHDKTVREAIAGIPKDKQLKYATALNYAVREMDGGLGEIQQIPYAIPCNPVMKLEEFKILDRYFGSTMFKPGSYHHEFALRWSSSNGDMDSLRRVGTRENVTFTSNPGGPPFNYVQANTPMHFTQGATTNAGANTGYNIDDHSTLLPSIICANPRVTGKLVAQQEYEYTTDGTNWHPMPGAAYLIEKGVRPGLGPGGLVYYLAKMNWAPANPTAYHFEVEYEIDPPPATMPPMGTQLAKGGFPQRADIADYGTVVHQG